MDGKAFLFMICVGMQSLCYAEKNYIDGEVDDVTFFTKANECSNQQLARKGILVRRPEAKATILICHGFMCDKNDVQFIRTMFADYNTFTFDFRAHGELKENQYCTLGQDEAYDVIGAAEYIKSQPDLKDIPLIVYGFSMGAASSILAQSIQPNLFTAAIWDCPFDSTEKLVARNIDHLKISLFGYEIPMPGKWILHRYAFNPYVQSILKASLKAIAKVDSCSINTRIACVNPEQAIKRVSIPTYFIVCKHDEKAPVEAVQSVYEGAAGFKRLWITEGRRHFDSFFKQPEKYMHKIRHFIDSVLENKLSTKEQAKIIIDNECENPSSNVNSTTTALPTTPNSLQEFLFRNSFWIIILLFLLFGGHTLYRLVKRINRKKNKNNN
jgi:pimeloyl-ACP methyl ester carboxylesterase